MMNSLPIRNMQRILSKIELKMCNSLVLLYNIRGNVFLTTLSAIKNGSCFRLNAVRIIKGRCFEWELARLRCLVFLLRLLSKLIMEHWWYPVIGEVIYTLELISFLTGNTVCLPYKDHCYIRKYSPFVMQKVPSTHKFCTRKMHSLGVSFGFRLTKC